MNKLNRVLTITLLINLIFSCQDPNKGPIVTFENAGHGAYPRLIEEFGVKYVNLYNIPGSQYGYTIEFVDEQKGDLVAEYILEIEYKDNNSENGDKSKGPIQVLSVPASVFTISPNGFKSVSVSISATGMFQDFGLSKDNVLSGDNFNISGTIVMNNGDVFSGANSSVSIKGYGFRGLFDFQMPAICPTGLTGAYEVTTTKIWCGGDSITGTYKIISFGSGAYKFDDWSFGTYGACYGTGVATGDLEFKEVCGVVSFTGFTDNFGDLWTFNSSVNGEEWTINWENSYGESATSVLTIPGLYFTVAE